MNIKKIFRISILGILLFPFTSAFAQKPKKDEGYIQFTGLVLSADSLQPLSYTVIVIPGTRRGTVTDYNGYFTIVAKRGEKLVFELLGYMKSEYLIPDSITGYKYSMVKLLAPDTTSNFLCGVDVPIPTLPPLGFNVKGVYATP